MNHLKSGEGPHVFYKVFIIAQINVFVTTSKQCRIYLCTCMGVTTNLTNLCLNQTFLSVKNGILIDMF